jgi:hypothetical protein
MAQGERHKRKGATPAAGVDQAFGHANRGNGKKRRVMATLKGSDNDGSISDAKSLECDDIARGIGALLREAELVNPKRCIASRLPVNLGSYLEQMTRERQEKDKAFDDWEQHLLSFKRIFVMAFDD